MKKMSHIKSFKEKDSFYVIMVKKTNIRSLEIFINDFKRNNIKFKVYDAKKGRNNDYYYIISKNFLGLSYNFMDNDLESYGDEVDYDLIISSNKYNV